jgi:hypothetical protein
MLSRAQTCIISTGDVNYLVDQKSRFSLRIELNSPTILLYVLLTEASFSSILG